jgi:hypothetical protein
VWRRRLARGCERFFAGRLAGWLLRCALRVFFALLLSAQMVVAPPAAKPTKVELGQRLFTQGDFEGALKVLDVAASEVSEPATLERVHVLRAQCLFARQDFARAEDAFALALEANPNASLDPGKVDPTVVKLLDSVRGRLSGTVVVGATPAGATISVDGKAVGVAPQTVSVGIGTRRVEVRWAEGEPAALEVTVRTRKEIRVEAVQAPAPPPKVVEAAPKPTPGLIERPLKPYGEVRGVLEIPSASDAAPRGGLDLGGGVEVFFFRFGLTVRLFPYFGLAPRLAFVLPLVERFSVFLEAHVPFWFRSAGIQLGLGGGAGAEFHPTPWLGVYGLVGGQYLFLSPGQNDDTHFTLSAGLACGSRNADTGLPLFEVERDEQLLHDGDIQDTIVAEGVINGR